MASNELTAALQFLTNAGHLLATTAPETSAYLMSRRTGLMFEHELPLSDKERQHVCTCCGHILLLGKGSQLQVLAEKRVPKNFSLARDQKGNARRRVLRSQPRSLGPTKAITCGYCERVTEVQLPAPAPISRRDRLMEKVARASGSGVSLTSPNPAEAAPSQKAKTNANASSKKRARSRKAGLQALLDQSRSSGRGLGLTLADFMAK